MGDAYQCDACGRMFPNDRPAVEVYPNPIARAVGGEMHFTDGPAVEWPFEDTDVELCAECAAEPLESIRGAMRDE